VSELYTDQPADESNFSVKWDGEWQITLEVFRDLGAAFARQHDVQLVLHLVQVQHVGGGVCELRLGEFRGTPIGALLFLGVLGGLGAKTGGAKALPAVLRVTFWGALAMGLTAGIGHLIGTAM
jgi:hypothetical protein